MNSFVHQLITEKDQLKESWKIIIDETSKTIDVRNMRSPTTFTIDWITAHCVITNVFKDNPEKFSHILWITATIPQRPLIQSILSFKQILYTELLSTKTWSLIERPDYRPRILFEKNPILYDYISCHEIFDIDQQYLSYQNSWIIIQHDNHTVSLIDLTKMKKPADIRIWWKEVAWYAFELYKKYKDTIFYKTDIRYSNSKIHSITDVQQILAQVVHFESHQTVRVLTDNFEDLSPYSSWRRNRHTMKRLREILIDTDLRQYNYSYWLYQFLIDHWCHKMYVGSFYESLDEVTKQKFPNWMYCYEELSDIKTILWLWDGIIQFINEIGAAMTSVINAIKYQDIQKTQSILHTLRQYFWDKDLPYHYQYICRVILRNINISTITTIELCHNIASIIPPHYNKTQLEIYTRIIQKSHEEIDIMTITMKQLNKRSLPTVSHHRLSAYIANSLLQWSTVERNEIQNYIDSPSTYKEKRIEQLKELDSNYELTQWDAIILWTSRVYIKTYEQYTKRGWDALRYALSIDNEIPHDRNRVLTTTDDDNQDQKTIRAQLEKYLSPEEYYQYLEGDFDDELIFKIKNNKEIMSILQELHNN